MSFTGNGITNCYPDQVEDFISITVLTPLWWVLKSSPAYSIEKDWLRIMKRIEDVRSYQDSLYIPIRLKTGVAEADVIANAVEQMRRIAATLQETCITKRG